MMRYVWMYLTHCALPSFAGDIQYTVFTVLKLCRIEQKQRLLFLGITGPKKKEHNYSIIRMKEN
jgi:hypothetical protein